jgi:group I intron endonuclease
MYVYLLTNNINGKYYVGQTKKNDLQKYFTFKKWCATSGNYYKMPIISAIAKYGWENFTVDVLAEPQTKEQMDNLERVWIVLLDSRNPDLGYNIAAGGSGIGIAHSQETKDKIGLANKGRKPKGYIRTELHKQQLRDRMQGNKVGKKFTSESARLAIMCETPENKAKRIAGIQRAWDRRRGITIMKSNT